jgi:hypothetical protein
MKSLAAAVVPVSAAVYFGYESLHGKPVKAALIGGGDAAWHALTTAVNRIEKDAAARRGGYGAPT